MKLIIEEIEKAFSNRFGSSPIVVQSPARVNLIGEHTDYNDGFVLPAAIDKKILLAMAPNDLNQIRLYAKDMEDPVYETEITDRYEKSGKGWPDYILGVVDQLQKRGLAVNGFDCLFGGDIPIGAGLSSSAALEGGVLTGLVELFNLDLTLIEMAQIGQSAENEFVGVQCGIMDQFANLFGQSESVIRLDCQSLEYSHFPFNRDDLAILLCDTKVRRELASSEYNVRRTQCEEGVKILREFDPSIGSLRDVSNELLENHKGKLTDDVYNRCRFVLDENQRVLNACDDLLRDDLESFGQRMTASHYGLKNQYEVSCLELDMLVEAAENLDAVYGSRMMGGGFGGCTINLVQEQHIDRVIETIKNRYEKEIDTPVEFYIARISKGAGLVHKNRVENR